MIIGTGIDIVETERISRAIIRSNHFVNRFFSTNEQLYFQERNNRYEVIAGNFAAKEAFSKALGTGIRNFALKDIEVLRDSLGKPYMNLYNEAQHIVEKIGATRIHISISHCKNYAVAHVILERE
ncbi:MAG: holo-ACP synthase [Clostridia bacterium]